MSSRALATVLAVCISVLVISMVVRTEFYVMEALLPLAENSFSQVVD